MLSVSDDSDTDDSDTVGIEGEMLVSVDEGFSLLQPVKARVRTERIINIFIKKMRNGKKKSAEFESK